MDRHSFKAAALLAASISLSSIQIVASQDAPPKQHGRATEQLGSAKAKVRPSHHAEPSSSTANQQVGQSPINVTVAIPEATPHEKASEAARERLQEATNQRIAGANDKMATFTFYLVVVGVLQVIAAWLSYRVASKSAAHAHDSAVIALAQKRLGDRQLDLVRAQTAISKTNADAAQQAADIAAMSLAVTQRGYLVFHPVWIGDGDGGPALRYKWSNDGNTPLTIESGFIRLSIDEPSFPDGDSSPPSFTVPIATAHVSHRSTEMFFDVSFPPLELEQRVLFKLNSLRVYLTGEFRYRDAFPNTPVHIKHSGLIWNRDRWETNPMVRNDEEDERPSVP